MTSFAPAPSSATPPVPRLAPPASDEISVLRVATLLVRHGWLIAGVAIVAAIVAGVSAKLVSPSYTSEATFLTGSADANGGLSGAAAQLGLTTPSGGESAWGPATYIEVLQSRSVLEPVARDTIRVPGVPPMSVMDYLHAGGKDEAHRLDAAVRALRGSISAGPTSAPGGVQLTVTTGSAALSFWLAQRLMRGLADFNRDIRQSQARAELEFVQEQVASADSAVRDADSQLEAFLRANRDGFSGSPELTFQRDRLQREVSLRNDLEETWLKNREDARVRLVRDTPVITVLEQPQIALLGKAPSARLRFVMGAVIGFVLGVIAAVLIEVARMLGRLSSTEAHEFRETVVSLWPPFRRRRAHSA